VLLKNKNILPLPEGTKVYPDGMLYPEALNRYGTVVKNIDDADVVVTRINTPYDERNKYFLESFFHQGRLYFTKEELDDIIKLTAKKPTIVIVNLERPAILTEINEKCSALLADFGADDAVIADILFGKSSPMGKLPFELPSSREAVKEQFEDVPYDSKDPLYDFGFGLRYE
jgi:beta-glucosidase